MTPHNNRQKELVDILDGHVTEPNYSIEYWHEMQDNFPSFIVESFAYRALTNQDLKTVDTNRLYDIASWSLTESGARDLMRANSCVNRYSQAYSKIVGFSVYDFIEYISKNYEKLGYSERPIRINYQNETEIVCLANFGPNDLSIVTNIIYGVFIFKNKLYSEDGILAKQWHENEIYGLYDKIIKHIELLKKTVNLNCIEKSFVDSISQRIEPCEWDQHLIDEFNNEKKLFQLSEAEKKLINILP